MKSLFQTSLVATGLVTASLALAGNAMAANVHAKTRATAAQTAYVDVAAVPPYQNYSSTAAPASRSSTRHDVAARSPYSYQYRSGQNFAAEPGIDVGQMIGAMLGMVPPQYAGIVQSAMRQAASHRSSGTSSGTYDPSFDSPTTSTPIDNSASDAGPDTAGMNTSTNPTWGALE
jgi:hypothetical protein